MTHVACRCFSLTAQINLSLAWRPACPGFLGVPGQLLALRDRGFEVLLEP